MIINKKCLFSLIKSTSIFIIYTLSVFISLFVFIVHIYIILPFSIISYLMWNIIFAYLCVYVNYVCACKCVCVHMYTCISAHRGPKRELNPQSGVTGSLWAALNQCWKPNPGLSTRAVSILYHWAIFPVLFKVFS